MVKRHAGWHTAIPIVAGYILDGGNKAIAAVHLKAILAGVQRLPYCLPVLIGDLHGRNQQLSFRLGGEIKEILSVCGLRGRQGFRCGVFYFCVFRGRGVHGSRLFDRLCIRASTPSGRQDRSIASRSNAAVIRFRFIKIPPISTGSSATSAAVFSASLCGFSGFSASRRGMCAFPRAVPA